MKILATLSLAGVFLVASCNEKVHHSQDNTANNETWNLVSMTSGMMLDSKEKSLEFQQTYTFKKDATFVKTQTNNSSTLTGSGTYTTQHAAEGTYYHLTYATQNEIVGSCTGRDNETLLLRPDGKIQNSWMMCDGPFLVYEKE